MRTTHLHGFAPRCPVCLAQGRDGGALRLAHLAAGTPDQVEAGILHCSETSCQHEYPVLDGIPVIVPELRRVLAEHSAEMLLREPEDATLQSLLGDALGPDSWLEAIRQVLSTYGWDGWADLDPDEAVDHDAPRPGAVLRCLDRLLQMAAPVGDAGLVVDLGCGAGRTGFALAEHCPDALVLGLDLHFGLLRLAQGAAAGEICYPRRRIGLVYDRRRYAVALPQAGRVDFWACDAGALPFAPGSVDLVLALNLLDCVAAPRDLLAGLATLLRPGGQALLATPFDWSVRATAVERWIGGHSQRAAHRGGAEPALHALLEDATHPLHVPGLRIVAESDMPWQTRLHDRSAAHYRTRLLVLQRTAASAA